jgi:hypothetical protein
MPIPPQERLEASHFVGYEVEQGLVEHHQLASANCFSLV